MSEWDLQSDLTKKFRTKPLIFDRQIYELICWELMFPSWKINDKFSKWNETSLDFVFYSASINTFLCIEIKNNIKTPKDLILAFCQTTDRAVKFKTQYTAEKIFQAHQECFQSARQERGGNKQPEKIEFGTNPLVMRVLMANSFPYMHEDKICRLNQLNHNEINTILETYSENKEFQRFKQINESDYKAIKRNNLQVIKVESLNI